MGYPKQYQCDFGTPQVFQRGSKLLQVLRIGIPNNVSIEYLVENFQSSHICLASHCGDKICCLKLFYYSENYSVSTKPVRNL